MFVPVPVQVHVPGIEGLRVHCRAFFVDMDAHGDGDDSGGVSWVGSNTEKRPNGDAAYFSVSRITSTTESSLLIFSITP